MDECPVCNGEGFDINGIACENCHGLGYGDSTPNQNQISEER